MHADETPESPAEQNPDEEVTRGSETDRTPAERPAEGTGEAQDAGASGPFSMEETLKSLPQDEETLRPLGETVHMSQRSDLEGVAEERPPARAINEREVKVVNVFQLEDREATFVLLQDGRGRRMPIWIGQHEAVAIYIAIQKEGHNIHRPLTHDLLKNVIEKLGGKVDRLTIDDIWQETFYARLVLNVAGKWVDIDCRPSDGIAVALRAQAPIYVAEEVLDSCKVGEE